MTNTKTIEAWEIQHVERMLFGSPDSGYVVQTKAGTGRTYHKHNLHFGKMQVFLDNGTKMLCRPENLTVIGFID